MRLPVARAWSKFLSDVAKARDTLEFEPNEECFYRGHGSSSWSLLPTLLRQCAEQEIDDLDDIRLIESALYFEFRARAQVIQPDTPNDWEVLFTMRHHSIATRLLDWTEVLAIAVYFAIRDAPTSSKPCVWLLNPYKLNEVSWELRDLIAPEHLLETADEFSDYLIDYTK